MGIEICIINPYSTVQSNKKLKHCVSGVIDKSSTVYMSEETIVEDYISSNKLKKISKLFISAITYLSMILTTISILYIVSS